MKLSEKQREFTRCIGKLIQFATDNGIELTLGDAYRDPRLHGEFGKKKSYSAASSVHKLRLAVDFNVFFLGEYIQDGNHTAYKLLGDYWESLHQLARWGGRFDDANHFAFEHNGFM